MSEQRPCASHLPSKPNLRHLKDQAKDRLANGDAPSVAMALFQVARNYGFPSWPKLRDHVLALPFAENLKEAIDSDDFAEVRRLVSKSPELNQAPIGYGGDGPLTMANESAIRERGCQNRDGNNTAITPERTTGSRARFPESIDSKMRFAAKLTAGQAAGRSPDIALR